MISRIQMGIAAAVLASSSTAALAAPTYYTDRAAFLAAAGAVQSEDFEAANGGGPTVNYADFSVSEINGSPNVVYLDGGNGVPTSGTQTINYVDNAASIGIFQFNSTITAFGIDLISTLASGLAIGGDLSTTLTLDARTPLFFGVIDTAGFSQITFDLDTPSELDFDTLNYGSDSVTTDVPEAATWAMFIAGFGAVGASLRRRNTVVRFA